MNNQQRQPDFRRWICLNGKAIEVDVWESEKFVHGSCFEKSFFVKDLKGKVVFQNHTGRLINKSSIPGKFSWETTFGYESKQLALDALVWTF